MEKKEKTKIDANFLKESEEEFEKAEKSGRLYTLMSQSVLSTRAERPTKEKTGGQLTMEEEKKFPTPAMLKAREEWAKKPEEEKEALWKASIEKARRHRPPTDLEALGENIEE